MANAAVCTGDKNIFVFKNEMAQKSMNLTYIQNSKNIFKKKNLICTIAFEPKKYHHLIQQF